jgi:3-hydroxyethyl bacteriochlorophyllide a dehydrogenase
MKTKGIVFEKPGEVVIRDFDMPACGPREIVTQTVYSFVSPGTELRVLAGLREAKGRFPLVPGYSWVGRVVEVGSELKGWRVGDLVSGRYGLPVTPALSHVYGGQYSHNRCEVSGDAVVKLPPGADPWDYVCAEIAAISWRGVSATFPASGETAVVIGQGLIGAFAAKWLLHHGAKVIVTDLEESRLVRARRWGAVAVPGRVENLAAELMSLMGGRGADIVVEASASRAGAVLAPSLLRQPLLGRFPTDFRVPSLHSDPHVWPRLLFLATYCDQTFEFTSPAGGMTVDGAIVLQTMDRGIDDRLQVIERIRAGVLSTRDIVDKPTPVAEAPRAYLNLRDHPGQVSALAFEW